MNDKPENSSDKPMMASPPIDPKSLQGDWEIHWYKLDEKEVNRPVEYKRAAEADSRSHWSQRVSLSRVDNSLAVRFSDSTDDSQCQMQGRWKDHDLIEFSFQCDDPQYTVQQAEIEVRVSRAYMPGEYTMEGVWRDNSGATTDHGRIELRSLFAQSKGD